MRDEKNTLPDSLCIYGFKPVRMRFKHTKYTGRLRKCRAGPSGLVDLYEHFRTERAGGSPGKGQCDQRLAIARCLLRDTGIILLDEATSSLDNMTQTEILKAIEERKGDRTVVMIAHRLSTVVNADMILFVEDGKILDHGTHQELLSRCESYRQLYEREVLPE